MCILYVGTATVSETGAHMRLQTSEKLLCAWRFGLDQRSYSTSGPVSAWMGDRLQIVMYAATHTQVNSARPFVRG